ncbi:MAG TPA: thiamine pyrophosphate-binding protein [Pseudomonadales bacterium]
MKTNQSGGAVLAESLATLGVKHVFALHGGHLDAFLVACPDAGVQLVDVRHEASAGHAAEAYARATGGRIGVAVITAGPGFTNALTSMVSAWLDALPVLFVAGSPPLREVATNPLQGGFDQVAMAAPVCKWAYRITHGERIPDLVDKAIRIARSGRPGPVFLELPIDVMFAPVRRVMLPLDATRPPPAPPAPSAATLEAMLSLLRDAERPVIVAGGGAILSPTAAAIARFAERSGIPVTTTSRAHGLLPHDHPNYAGGAGTITGAMLGGAPPDLVVLAGARQGLFTGGRGGGIVPTEARLIQIDVDGGEIGRLRPADLAVVADCAATFEALAEAAGGHRWPDRRGWIERLRGQRNPLAALFEREPVETAPGRLHPYHAAKAALAALPAEAAVVCDGGESSGWCDPHLRPPGPGLFMTNGYLGCLGFGPGAAIGIATAQPGRPVAVFSGDGAAGFHIAELDTMVRHRLPIVTVVLNNACWGMSQHGQDLVYGRNRRSIVGLADTQYEQVAAGFGCHGERVDRYDDIAPAIRRAFAAGRPACVNLIIDADVVHPVTPAMVGNVDAADEIAVPYYENIPAHESP